MKQMLKHAIVALACLAPACVAQGQRVLGLEDCIGLALENNSKVRVAALAQTQAEQRRKEAFTSFFPSVSASGGVYMMNRYTLDVEFMGMSVMRLLKDGNYAMLSAVQPIYAGGRLLNGNRLAKVGVEVSRLQGRKTVEDVCLETEKYYWDIVAMRSKLLTVDAMDSMAARLLADVTVAVEAGVRTRNDLLQVQLRQNEIEGDRLRLRHGLSTNMLLLAECIGMGSGEFTIRDSICLDLEPAFPEGLRVDHRAALLDSPDYQLLEKNLRASTLNRRLEVGKNLPELAVGAGILSHDIVEERQNRGLLFATLSVPISGWWGGSHAIRRMRAAEQAAREQLESNSELLVIQMENCWNQVEEAYQQLRIARRSIAQSEENLRINESFYRAGTVSMSELLQAQSLYQQSAGNCVQSYADYSMALARYLVMTSQYGR